MVSLSVKLGKFLKISFPQFGMMCPVLSIMNMFAAGIDDLRLISEATASVYNLLQRKHHEALQRILRPYHQMIFHLRGVSPETDPSVLTGAIMSEDEDIRYLKEHHNSTIEFSLGWCRALMLFHLHNFGEARVLLDRCQNILCQCPQVFLAPMQICLEYVSATTSSRLLWKYKRQQTRLSLAQTKRRAFLESSLQGSLTVLRSLGRDCAENAQPQALMIQGEWQALNDQVIAAQDSFQQAIEDCDSSHALGIKAMFCEQAGLTLRVCSLDDTALNYLEDSCAAYRAWGAFFKVHQIKSNVIPEALNKWDE